VSIFIVGADHLGNIDKKLTHLGFSKIIHTSGRKKKHYKLDLPDATDYVLVFTDYVCHNISKEIKKKAKNKGIPVLFCKRSWSHIQQELQRNNLAKTVNRRSS